MDLYYSNTSSANRSVLMKDGFALPQGSEAKSCADPEAFKKVESAFEFLDIFLEGQEFVAGKHLTLADISILATVSTFDIFQFDIKKYPNVDRWYTNTKKVTPGWEENWKSLTDMKAALDSYQKQSKKQ
ncbi:uncharacterized protein Dwil_GK11203 [Drosophila willistoni]|uniref:GST C-terminal domain-containing protein n=1 Tax=Drosophila willistoni TaxID=7260 RepID=B4NBC9_DROWI|nr:uncharacterized protein Dwil_GK11203 [Drosophila willistoni]